MPEETFLTEAPELVPLQTPLEQLWRKIMAVPVTKTGDVIDIPSTLPVGKSQIEGLSDVRLVEFGAGDLVAVYAQGSESERIAIWQLKESPRVVERYPKRPYEFTHDHTSKIGPSPIYLEKWPNGYRIDQEGQQYTVNGHDPVDPDCFYHQKEVQFRKLNEDIVEGAKALTLIREIGKKRRLLLRAREI